MKNEVQNCIEECGSINAVDGIGQTLLHAAACTGNNDLVTWLLHKGADIDWADAQGWTPLLGAISSQQADTAFLLLKKGASVHGTCERGMTCLHLLARWPAYNGAQEKLTREVVAAGLDINVRSEAGETPLLHLCRKRENCVPLTQLFLELGADPKIADFSGLTPLHMAAATDNITLGTLLIDAGACLDADGPEGTPLMTAMRKRNKKIMKLLVGPQDLMLHNALLERIMRMLLPADLHRAMRTSRKFREIGMRISGDKDYWFERYGTSKEDYIQYITLVKGFKYRLDALKIDGFIADDDNNDNNNNTQNQQLQQQQPQRESQLILSPALQQQQNRQLRLAIAVLGGPAVGKSSFLLSACEDRGRGRSGGNEGFDPFASMKVESLASADFRSFGKMSVLVNISGQRVELVLIEVPYAPSMAVESSMAPLWKLFAGCVVLVDTTRKNGAYEGIELVTRWEALCPQASVKNAVVCGAKADRAHKGFILNSLEMMRFCDERNMQYHSVSVLNPRSVVQALKLVCDKLSASKSTFANALSLSNSLSTSQCI